MGYLIHVLSSLLWPILDPQGLVVHKSSSVAFPVNPQLGHCHWDMTSPELHITSSEGHLLSLRKKSRFLI